MTFGEKLRNVLAAAKQQAGAAWSQDRWVRTVDEFAEVERPIGKDGKARKPKRTIPINQMTEEGFLEYLRAEPALVGIDIEREIGKCRFHFKAQGVVPSRMRLVRWLNKADKTLSNHGRDQATRAADMVERGKSPPHGWQEFMKEKARDWAQKNGDRYDPPGQTALQRDDFFGMPKEWRDAAWRELGGGA